MSSRRRDGLAARAFPAVQLGDGARAFFVAALCAALTAGAEPSWADAAEEETVASYRANDEDDWKFDVGINPWFTFINGAITIQDNTTPVDIDFSDLWSQLHMALMAEVEVQKGDVGFFTDLSWAFMWTRMQGSVFQYESEINWVLFDFGLYYELSLDLCSGPLPPRLRLQPFIGGRYQYYGLDVLVRPTPGNRVLTPVSHAAAPILGLRGFLDLGEHWNVTFVGDGGGFGVDGIEKTWQGELMGGYRFRRGKAWDLNLLAGYKGVGVDLRSATGAVEGYLIYHGPMLKIGLEF